LSGARFVGAHRAVGELHSHGCFSRVAVSCANKVM
jgi:hypothetical protein